jgi:signal transduction histidine kinase
MTLTRLRLIATAAPAALLLIVGYLVRGPFHEELHSFPGYLFVFVTLAGAVIVFTFFVFEAIDRIEKRLLEQTAHVSALLAVARAGSSSLDLSEVLEAALDEIVSVTSAETGEVWLTVNHDELVLTRQWGSDLGAFSEPPRLRFGEGLVGIAAERHAPVVVHDLAADPRVRRPEPARTDFESFYAQPLLRREEVVGVLAVAARPSNALASSAEAALLEGIGEQLVIAIENARLHERVLDEAVLEERERLARELHDGLAQVLGYVNTHTLAIEKLLAANRSDEAEAQVERMRQAALRAYEDVREAILGLRSGHDGLGPSLRQYVDEFGHMTGIEVELRVDRAIESVRLAPDVEVQLIRITQEALANVRKHARAKSVSVDLRSENGSVVIEVADDGFGFDPDHPVRTGWPHFGLQSMRERTEAIGGKFELWSELGSGTRIVVHAPATTSRGAPRASAAR